MTTATTFTDSAADVADGSADLIVVDAVCTRCGDWAGDAHHPDPPDLDAVLEGLAAAGWQVRDGRLECPACTLRSVCETTGHHWGRWTTIGPSLCGRSSGGRVRHCRVCTAGEFDTQ